MPADMNELRDLISSALSYTSAGADCFALTDAVMPLIGVALAAAWDEGYDAPRVLRWRGPSGSMALLETPLPRRNPYEPVAAGGPEEATP